MLNKITSWIKMIVFRIKLHNMDERWLMRNGQCFEMYPPSFYYLHTPEEQEKIQKHDEEKIIQLIQQL